MQLRGALTGIVLCGIAYGLATAQQGRPVRTGTCRFAAVEGQVEAGQTFRHAIVGGARPLEVVLVPAAQPTSGWEVRIMPLTRATDQGWAKHDYADLATPPYRSPNPLLLTTDFHFRAQDVVGWNPRRFHYVADPPSFQRLLSAYTRYDEGAEPGTGIPKTPASTAAQHELLGLTSKALDGEVDILDARLAPGSADQTPMAAAVASHYASTPHSIAQGSGSPLGSLEALRFRVKLRLATGIAAAPGVAVSSGPCE